jgi:uncharacterized repeat protein (TIGR01451 family)
MKNTIKRILAAVTAVVSVAVLPATVLAYGPIEGTDGRKYFDYNDTKTYPQYPAFNSFKNSPTWGFEPDFMSIKESTSSTWDSDDKIQLQAGKTYDVVVFYHNNAPADTHTALNTKMKIDFPSVVKGGVETKGTASISASNSTPREVWSTLTFTSTSDMLIRYKQGSASIKYSGGSTKTLPNSGKNLFEGGQLLGANLDGNVPGCDKNSGMVQFQIVADQPNFTINKQVRINNDGKATGGWVESVNAQPGDTVDFLITYKNTGTIQQNDVVIKDKLPAGLTYINGSARYYNATNPTSTGGHAATDDVTGVGLNVGNYAPGADAMVKFSAKVSAKKDLPCGKNTITNIGRVETNNGSKEDPAVVIVNGEDCPPKECKPGIPEGDARCEDPKPKECKPGIPEGDPRCEDPKPKECKPGIPEGDPRCYDLPKTGPEEVVISALAIGSIATAGTYYVRSRKASKK